MFKIIGADQQQYGPVSAEQIRQWVAQGRANAQTLIQAEGSMEWKPLASHPEFADLGGPPPISGAFATPGPSGFGATRPEIPSYLVPAILTTVCCCLPFGIVAIVYAAQVKSKINAGDIAGAKESSRKAQMWTWIAIGTGIVVVMAELIAYFALGGFQFSLP